MFFMQIDFITFLQLISKEKRKDVQIENNSSSLLSMLKRRFYFKNLQNLSIPANSFNKKIKKKI